MRFGKRSIQCLLGLVCFAGLLNSAAAQAGLCPSNLNFEIGSLIGWECRAGTTASNPLPLTGPIPGRHTIIDAATAGLDPFGGFPEISPLGSNYSVKLGNHSTQSQAESISYIYTIPSNLTVFSMLLYYAVVIESPGHVPSNQPRFQARIIDVATGQPIPCVDFDFIAQTTPGGFQTSLVPGNNGSPVLYKDWTPISINLNAYIGRTIMLELITKDCSQGGHAGYAYIDVGTVCNGAISGNYICPGDPGITLTAPFGFQNYTWYSDNTFSTILSTSQTLTLNPPPAVGTIFPVKIEPFPGFGCQDTLYATVDVGTKPVANAGNDKTICGGDQIQIGGPPQPAQLYSWQPSGLVSDPNAADPLAGPVSVPTEFIITVTDQLTGCVATDTTIVDNFLTDTLVTTTGIPSTCINDPRATLSVKNSSTAVQWFEVSGGQIPGATGISFTPQVSGIYWAEVIQGGCVDSTGNHAVAINPLPIPDFMPSSDTGCVTRNSFSFTNNSNSPDNSALSYLWRFNDGITDINTDAIRTYSLPGTYSVKLITTTAFGCTDSTTSFTYHVLPNGVPDFVWDSICTGRPVQFSNRSNENGAVQAWYSWNFANGDPLTTAKNPLPVVYNTNPGKLDVILKMATLGCESDTQTVVKTVQVNRQAPGKKYPTLTVPEGSSKWLRARDSIGTIYTWTPQLQLSNYNAQYTEFTAVDDVDYLIRITDVHTCITTDTLKMQVLKKPGYYLPTAFTPNGDGLNDLARPYLIRMKGLKRFAVYNRTGQLIYYTATEGQGWDGKYNGVEQGNGVYVWILEFYDQNNKLVTEKGTLTLIR